jgi:hypothetical protein
MNESVAIRYGRQEPRTRLPIGSKPTLIRKSVGCLEFRKAQRYLKNGGPMGFLERIQRMRLADSDTLQKRDAP